MKKRIVCALVLLGAPLIAQSSGDADLDGQYHYQVLAIGSRAGMTVDVAAKSGDAEFDEGAFRVDGGEHAHRKDPGGIVVLDGFVDGFGSFDGRVSAEANAFMGVSAAFGGSGGAVIVALRRPRTEFSPAEFNGSYQAVLISVPQGATQTPNFSHAPFESAQAVLTAASDGTGTLSLPAAPALGLTEFQVAVSEDGDWIIGEPSGVPGLFIAARRERGVPSAPLWLMEMSVDSSGTALAIGGLVHSGGDRARIFERWTSSRGVADYRGEATIAIQNDGGGLLNTTPVEVAGGGLLGGLAGVRPGLMLVGMPAPSRSDDDVFANPHGNVSAASFSPIGDPAAPRQLRSLFGANLATGTAAAASLPLPTTLLGSAIELSDGASPLLFVSPTQVNYQVPPAATGPMLRLVARNGDDRSDEIFARLSATSPAVFSIDGSGGGPGIFTHADFTLVTQQNPARAGEMVIVFLTGLGVNQPLPQVWTGALASEVLFAGQAPGFAGLDQMNFRIPIGVVVGDAVPFTIANREGWSDTTSIAIGP